MTPKIGNPEDLNNWRPVKITNCYCRIVSDVLENRLKISVTIGTKIKPKRRTRKPENRRWDG